MLIDDGLLRREERALGRSRTSWPSCPCRPRSMRCSPPGSSACPEEERALLGAHPVEGTVFHRGAMRELATEALAPLVDRSLTALVRKDMIRPDRSSFVDDEAFRFRHMLIRDAAYRSLPKEARADLHAAVRGLGRGGRAARA